MKRVLIVGAGVDAWMAAAGLATATRGLAEVVVAETGPTPSGRIAALPSLQGLHARLGISDEGLVRATNARPRLAARYSDGIEPFGETGVAIDGVAFHHYWLAAGRPGPLSDWSLAAQAAARGRFAPPSPDPRSPLSTLSYGLSLDAAGYADLLRQVALKAGAVVTDGRPDADLKVDASAGEGLLVAHEPWSDWSAWLPNGVDLAEDSLLSTFAPAPAKTGRIAQAMTGDTVAIGTAYGVIGAGDGGDLHLLQGDVSRLIALFPTGPAAVAEYNRLAESALERARDMAILRWGDLSKPPETLARKIEQFESRGRVVTYDDEAWPESAWIHAFLARGIIPRRWDPLADRVPPGRIRDMLGRMKAMLEQTAETMPRV
ncbi:MAG: tryptophan halogenase family protein [Caulobacter sp.]